MRRFCGFKRIIYPNGGGSLYEEDNFIGQKLITRFVEDTRAGKFDRAYQRRVDHHEDERRLQYRTIDPEIFDLRHFFLCIDDEGQQQDKPEIADKYEDVFYSDLYIAVGDRYDFRRHEDIRKRRG